MSAIRGHELTDALAADFGQAGTAGSRIACRDIGTGELFAITGTDIEDHDGITLHIIQVRRCE